MDQKNLWGPIALVAAVLLVGAMLYIQQTRSTTYPIPSGGTSGQTVPGGSSGSTGSTGTTQTGPPTEVPKGQSLKDYVTAYYGYLKAADYAKAYKMLPADRKGGEEGYIQTQSGMPVKSFKVLKVDQSGNQATVAVQQSLGGQGAGFPWTTTWTFKKSGGSWIVEGTQSTTAQ